MRSLALIAFLAVPLCAAEPLQFNRDIRPILSDVCYQCHGPDANKRSTELRLDVAESATGDLGGYRAIAPGKLDESELWTRITSTDPTERMPPPKSGRQLTAAQIETLGRWIREGAPFEKHWSFVPPKRPAFPAVKQADWPINGLDIFVLARLEAEGLQPSPVASKETLLRRVTLDLTGLPPSLAELDAFLADVSPDAYERAVDRVLASPRYGERMIQEWLDAARYADTNGYQTDGTRTMWPWRDWVLTALNANMPFDQFTREQIAGDLLPEATLSQKIATGFHRAHPLNGEGGRIPEESRVDYVVDRVETTSTVWLGLTLGCCRCHDHKYDPFTQGDFYGLSAYFNSIDETGGVDRRSGSAAPTLDLPTPEQTQKIQTLEARTNELDQKLKLVTEAALAKQAEWEQSADIAKLPANVQEALKVAKDQRSTEQAKVVTEAYLGQVPERQEVQKQLDDTRKALNDARNSVLLTMVMQDRKEPRETFILQRGAYDKYGEKVTHAVPTLLAPLPADAPLNRLALADWLIDPANPLPARVTVNRFWQQFFGIGLVKTVEDFGVQGDPPSHPELLDWLAVEFQSDWDMKRLHRLIVTSATYRQSSAVSPELLERDPENRLLARGPRFRLSSQSLRDQALAVSGLLVERLGGPPVRPYQPPGLWEEFSFGRIKYVQDHGESLYRRSLYTFWRRSVAPTMLFDTANRQVCSVRQSRTNTPLHALILLNDPTFVEASRAFAERVLKEPLPSTEARLAYAFRLSTGRQPTAAETQTLQTGLEELAKPFRADPASAATLLGVGESPRDTRLDAIEHAAWTSLASLLLNLDEVQTRE